MFTAIGLQAVVTILGGLVTLGVSETTAALSYLLGGAAAFIPNALFALRLALHRGRSPESYPAVFFLGEFAKIGLTVAMLAGIIKSYPGLNWLALLMGLIVALKVPLFALWMTGNRQPIDQVMQKNGLLTRN